MRIAQTSACHLAFFGVRVQRRSEVHPVSHAKKNCDRASSGRRTGRGLRVEGRATLCIFVFRNGSHVDQTGPREELERTYAYNLIAPRAAFVPPPPLVVHASIPILFCVVSRTKRVNFFFSFFPFFPSSCFVFFFAGREPQRAELQRGYRGVRGCQGVAKSSCAHGGKWVHVHSLWFLVDYVDRAPASRYMYTCNPPPAPSRAPLFSCKYTSVQATLNNSDQYTYKF